MKSSPCPPGGGATCPERSYHGTRMNKRALTFHTQLHDWSDAKQLSLVARQQQPHPAPPARANTEIYLPVKRHNQIENWMRDVNKYYRPDRGPRVKSGSFMVIDVSKFNLNGDKQNLSRVKSAVFPSHSKARITSAFNSTVTSRGPKRFFGTDCHTVNNKLIDTQMHYSAQRRNLYSRSSEPGQPGNNTPDVTREDTTLDLHQESDSETLSTLNTSHRGSEGWENPALASSRTGVESAQSPTPAPAPLGRDILQPQITARSWSNRTLNVISIDDCKLTCRYRPQTIKETHEPQTNRVGTELGSNDNKETRQTADATRKKDNTISRKVDKVDNAVSSGDEADNEEETSEDIVDIAGDHINSIHISNGVDPNNNESVVNFENTKHEPTDVKKEQTNVENEEIEVQDKRSEAENGRSEVENGLNIISPSTSTSSGNHVRPGQVNFRSDKGSIHTPSDKTSYGRITNLYSTSAVTANTKERKRRKQTRSYKINHAISDMVEGRRVMNSMERDFDSRTAQFGRTLVEKSDGSHTFQKIHANLRRKIDTFLDTHSAIKTQQFYQQRRNNSCRPASPAPQKTTPSPVPQKTMASPAPQKNGISPTSQKNGLVHAK